MSTAEWRVLAHGPAEPLAENLWRVEGALPGMSLRRVMTVAKRTDGRLVVHSAIALEEGAMTFHALERKSVVSRERRTRLRAHTRARLHGDECGVPDLESGQVR